MGEIPLMVNSKKGDYDYAFGAHLVVAAAVALCAILEVARGEWATFFGGIFSLFLVLPSFLIALYAISMSFKLKRDSWLFGSGLLCALVVLVIASGGMPALIYVGTAYVVTVLASSYRWFYKQRNQLV